MMLSNFQPSLFTWSGIAQRQRLIGGLCFLVLTSSQGASPRAQDSSLFHNPLPQVNANSDLATGAAPAINGNAASGPGSPQAAANPAQSVSPYQGSGIPLSMAANVPMQPGMPLGRHPSYYHLPPPQKRLLKIHDTIQIRVDEMSRMTADGIAAMRKNGIYDAVLEDWIALEGLTRVRPDRQREGDPTVSGQTNQTFRANSQVITRESLTFNIAAEIADIRPNGNIVLEAHKSITNNDNRWEISLSGECQDRDIGPDNTVLSRNIINLKIDKQETGQARDGYRRGWFSEFISRFQPF